MASSFFERTDELKDLVGQGDLEGHLVVDQAYARVQHESLDFKHVHGGTAKFVEKPLMEGYRHWYQRLADAFGDRPLNEAMIDNVEDFVVDAEVTTPVEFGDLAQSGHPSVTSDGEVVYDRAPVIHRLSKEELDAKSDILHPRERGDHTPHPGHGHGPRTYLPKTHPQHGTTYHRPKP